MGDETYTLHLSSAKATIWIRRELPLSMYALRGVQIFLKNCVHMYICPVHGDHGGAEEGGLKIWVLLRTYLMDASLHVCV